MACFFLDLASLLVYNYSTVWPAGFILVAECVASSVEAMALLNDTTEDKLDHSKPSTDHILLITFLTWLFVVTCILLFFYYHWQVCRYLVTTKQGPLWSDSYSNYYPGKRTRKNQREYWSKRILIYLIIRGKEKCGSFSFLSLSNIFLFLCHFLFGKYEILPLLCDEPYSGPDIRVVNHNLLG